MLEHERYRVCNLDPLKIVLVQALSAAFFSCPRWMLYALAISRVVSSPQTAER